MIDTRYCRITRSDSIPALAEADTLIVGGSLAGCVAAYTLVGNGRKVILAASGCSVPHEMAVGRRPWVTDEDLARLPEPFGTAFRECIEHQVKDGSSILNLSRLAIRVEDLLLDGGVHLYYGMTPCGAVTEAGSRLTAVVFGGKFGLQSVAADCIIDGTPTAIVSRLAGCQHQGRPIDTDRVNAWMSAKVSVVTDDKPIAIDGPESKQACPTAWPDEDVLRVSSPVAVDGQVSLHGPYADFALKLPVEQNDPLGLAKLSVLARQSLVEWGNELASQRAAEGKRPLYFHRFAGAMMSEPALRVHAGGDSKPFCPAGLENVWICSAAVDLDDESVRPLADPYGLLKLATDVAANILSTPSVPARSLTVANAPMPPSTRLLISTSQAHVGSSFASNDDTPQRLRFQDPSLANDGRRQIEFDGAVLPILTECEVLVAGGGTSGVPAALAAAQSGAKVILIEQNADVGGTQTVGGVGNYWFGRETPFLVACDEAYAAASRQSGMAREISMLKCLTDAGVTVLAPCTMVGVVCKDDLITGVVVATDQGLGVITGQIVVDATGDADVAAWSGAPFEFGNGRDAWTMWASFGNFNVEKRTASRQYESAADVRQPHDFARTIVRGRRRQGMWRRFAHDMPQLYVTPRESRRILGHARVTYGGILSGETFPDVMTVCQSNFDIKGIASSDLICCGVIWSWKTHTQYVAAIPFRAIRPRHVTNLLVAGRSYCVSHDALALARMQRDMTSLGAGAGIAAAMSIRTRTELADLDIASLQREWVRRGTLREKDLLQFGSSGTSYSLEDARRDASEMVKEADSSPQRLARLASSTLSISPLRDAFEATRDQDVKIHIARLLCYLGDATAAPFLIKVIEKQVRDGLPRAQTPTLALPPEHGWAPEPVFSLYAVGLAKAGREVVGLMESIAHLIKDSPDVFQSREDSPFEYVRVICAVAERNPSSEMVRPLEVLYRNTCLRKLSIPRDGDPRLTVDPALERQAYLELCLGRALARCADRRGYDILLRYAEDIRGSFARSASDELAELLGGPLPNDCTARQRLVSRQVAMAVQIPLNRTID